MVFDGSAKDSNWQMSLWNHRINVTTCLIIDYLQNSFLLHSFALIHSDLIARKFLMSIFSKSLPDEAPTTGTNSPHICVEAGIAVRNRQLVLQVFFLVPTFAFHLLIPSCQLSVECKSIKVI